MITLPVNKFLGALTNLIAYTQVAYTADEGEVGRFVASCQDINIDNGAGKVVRSSDLYEVEDLPTTSTILTAVKPTVQEQALFVENYKMIQLTTNRYLLRGAFVEETAMADFVAYLLSIMRSTKTKYMSDQLLAKLSAYEPAQATQKVEIHIFNTSTLTDPMQLEYAERYNAKIVQKVFINTLRQLGFPTNKYNDLELTEIIDFSKLKLLILSNEDTDLIVDSLAYLLHSDKITDAQKWGETYVIPNEQFTEAPTYTAWLMHDKKLNFGYFYEVATSFFDASTLNQQDFLHFSYYMDLIDAYPCVAFKITADKKPTALTNSQTA